MDNDGYFASLEVGKVYRQLKPRERDRKGWVRIIDESGEDYLFPTRRFASVTLPPRVKRAIEAAAVAN